MSLKLAVGGDGRLLPVEEHGVETVEPALCSPLYPSVLLQKTAGLRFPQGGAHIMHSGRLRCGGGCLED